MVGTDCWSLSPLQWVRNPAPREAVWAILLILCRTVHALHHHGLQPQWVCLSAAPVGARAWAVWGASRWVSPGTFTCEWRQLLTPLSTFFWPQEGIERHPHLGQPQGIGKLLALSLPHSHGVSPCFLLSKSTFLNMYFTAFSNLLYVILCLLVLFIFILEI